jgi:hypothetical protein
MREISRLAAVTIYDQRLSGHRLFNKMRDDATCSRIALRTHFKIVTLAPRFRSYDGMHCNRPPPRLYWRRMVITVEPACLRVKALAHFRLSLTTMLR